MKYILPILLICFLSISCKEKLTSTLTKGTKTSQEQINYKNVDVASAKQMIEANKDLVIIDVRTPEETAEGMIPNAIEIDYRADSFDDEIQKLDRNKQYLVYCRSGARSLQATESMIRYGFKDVTNMKGGFNAWK